MTAMTQETLQALRLPELQARYAEIVGEKSRSPNKKFLIRRILETLEAQAAVAAEEEAPAAEQAARAEDEATATQEARVVDDAAGAADGTAGAADDEARAADTAADTDMSQVAPDAAERTATAAGEDTPLRKLTVSELQARYLDVVGRPTSSSHRRYLIWKIREAQKGRVPVGPRTRRNPGEPAPDYKILPFRMEAELVERLDAARERMGLKSRMDLFRHALAAYLETLGEIELAAAVNARP